jgi:cytochrome c peroxidase
MKIFKIAVICTAAIGLLAGMALAAGSAAKGKILFNDPKFANGTKGVSCNTCHPNGKGLENAGARTDLAKIINACIVKANGGKALDPNSAEMADMIAYIKSLKAK